MRALLLAVAVASAHRPAFAQASRKDVDASQQRFIDLSQRIEVEHDRAKDAFLAAGTPYPLWEAELDLEALSRRVTTDEIVISLQSDPNKALEMSKAEFLELSGRLASYQELVGAHVTDVDQVRDGLKKLFDADAEMCALKAELVKSYQGHDRFAVVVAADGKGKLGLRVFAPKSMLPAEIAQALQKSASARRLPVQVYDMPDLEP